MTSLVASDALTTRLQRVSADHHARNSDRMVFAVFESEDAEAKLLGVLTTAQVARFPQRIFADLLPRCTERPVPADTDLDAIWMHMDAVHADALPVVDTSGNLLGAVTRESLWDVMLAHHRSLLSDLAVREAQQRQILHAIPDDFLCLTANGVLVEVARVQDVWRHGGKSLWPLASKSSIGQHVSALFSPEVANTLTEGVQRCLAAQFPCSAAFTIREGQVIREYEARFTSWSEGNVLVVCRNVTELLSLRAQLETSERMVALGTLAAGVAHEINNPLTYVSSNLELLQELLTPERDENEQIRASAPLLEEMREGLQRVRNTVRDLKLFSRSDDLERHPVDVAHVLETSINLAASEIRLRARLTRDFDDVPAVLANEGQIGQVFLNLLINAAQSIPEGHASSNEIRVVASTASDGRVVIEIHDTGTGFSEDVRSRIFQPFFTTKAVGAGTGLGLSICHGIIQGHQGAIEVESMPGKGSVFRVLLPAVAGRAKARSSVPPPLAARPAGKFLIIDDEPPIVRTYARLLGAEQCVTCLSGAGALELVQGGQRFDAIICDLMMPDTSGIDVYEHLLRTAPDQAARIIFATGGAFTDSARQFLLRQRNPVINKPFDAARLFGCIERVLAENKATLPQ